MVEIITYFILFTLFGGWIVALFSYGELFLLLFMKNYPVKENYIPYCGITGIIVLISLVIIINFFTPISLLISILFLITGIGIALYFIVTRGLNIKKAFFYGFIAGLLFFVMIINYVQWYDLGLYHLTAIKWIIENITPLGLANLHSRLGYNTAWFPLSAIIDQEVFLQNRPIFLINSIILYFYITLLIERLLSKLEQLELLSCKNSFKPLIKEMLELKAYEVFLILSIFPITLQSRSFLSNPSPDYPVFLLTLIFFVTLIKNIEDDIDLDDTQAWIPSIIALLACTIKLSAVVLLPMALIAVFLQQLQKRNDVSTLYAIFENTKLFIKKIPGFCYILAILITIPLGIRGLMLSGNPIFPITFGSFKELPWAISIGATQAEASTITAWARLPGVHYLDSLNSFSWINTWVIAFITSQKVIIGLTIIAMIIAVIILKIHPSTNVKQISRRNTLTIEFPFLVLILGITFWFITAPDPRFGIGYLYSLPLFFFVYPFLKLPKPHLRWLEIWKIIIIFSFIFMSSSYFFTNYNYYGLNNKDNELPSMPFVPIIPKQTWNGEVVYVTPEKTDQVWNLPLPNTPYYDLNLTIIRDKKSGQYLMFLPPERRTNHELEREYQ